MKRQLKFKFDPHQEHQLKAIESTIKLFDGFSPTRTDFQMGDEIVPNLPPYAAFEPDWLLDNLNLVRQENGLPRQWQLDQDNGLMLTENSLDSWAYPQFTIEMETGTGKTYIYIRTIFELRKNYGFRKFVIIVPSIAIYEGVIKSFEIPREHFYSLYGNEKVEFLEYSGQQISKLRSFATSSFTTVLLMTIDSFNKASNIIFKPTEKLPGEMLPFQYIQQTRPILILDESQNYRSEKSKQALRTLKPLLSLNYSATPMDKPNFIYLLTPVDAFKQNLVKKIEVLGVSETYNTNQQQLRLELVAVKQASYGLAAQIRLFINRKGEMVETVLDLRRGDDLFEKTNNENYRGIKIDIIDKANNVVVFSNQDRLLASDGRATADAKTEIFRTQIEHTISYHFQKQKELLPKGIKVLSLFFIDRVANYVAHDGLIKRLFDEAYQNLKARYPYFKGWSAEEVRDGYFAKKTAKNQPDEFIDTHIEDEQKTSVEKELEKAAYELIMKDKERLLSFDEKKAFIFAHSALKEGWDNPNVFQICTLNQTRSEMKKRQEIGRGLRLAVNQDGERVTGDDINILTVIANESYESYVTGLQQEYYEAGDAVPPKPSQAGKTDVTRNERLFQHQDFRHFWERLCQKTAYQIHFDTESFVTNCTNLLERTEFPEPQIVISKGQFIMTEVQITLLDIKAQMAKIRVEITDTGGNQNRLEKWYHEGADLARDLKNPLLKGFKIVKIEMDPYHPKIVFGDKGELSLKEMTKFHSEKGQQTVARNVQEAQTTYPVFNIIERAAQATNLTRTTILRIFKSLSERTKSYIFKNPEGFCTVFIKTIREHLADHIAGNIEYTIQDELEAHDIEAIFPPKQNFPQKELVNGANWSLYNRIQIDSDIEQRFVENRLNADDKIICYFKFPAKFRINIPKIIGNYNPDWGIIRWDDDQRLKLELVRETKGQLDPNLLQFRNEKRKLDCAKRHFQKIRIDYKMVTDGTLYWWR